MTPEVFMEEGKCGKEVLWKNWLGRLMYGRAWPQARALTLSAVQ